MINLRYAHENTPCPNDAWRQLSDVERVALVVDNLRKSTKMWSDIVSISEAKEDGQIIVNIVKSLPASQRGSCLMDIEAYLKDMIDPAMTIWLEPLGDRNSLRNLRGIEVKS